MLAKQLSVFVENRKGRLGEVLNVLAEHGVNILSMSLADTTEYGLLRLIVNHPELGKAKLTAAGFSSLLSDVLVIEIPHKAGALQSLLKCIEEAGISVEYMYGLSMDVNEAYVVLKASDATQTEKVLLENGVKTLSNEQIKAL
ncbi:MAG: ACT domain-containing protein [Ruminococcaceae bacterium]|nr:ACT domain-containing protein [Oscillospiraceae bacterium]